MHHLKLKQRNALRGFFVALVKSPVLIKWKGSKKGYWVKWIKLILRLKHCICNVVSRKLSILSNIVQSEARRAEESKIWQNGQIEVYRLF